MIIIKFGPVGCEKKQPNNWVTDYPNGRCPDWRGAIEFDLLDVRFEPELQPKGVALNKLLDFNGKNYL